MSKVTYDFKSIQQLKDWAKEVVGVKITKQRAATIKQLKQ